MNERYKVICGDALIEVKNLADSSVDAVITDPPYASTGRTSISKSSSRADNDWFLGDCMGVESYIWWMRQIAREALRATRLGGHAHVFTDWRQYTNLVTAWETVGWTLKSVIVWDKARGGALGSFWRNNHEFVCVFAKGRPNKLPHHGFYNTFRIPKPQKAVHPTEKPLELMRHLCSSIAPSGLILDMFTGSGTTGVAALLEGHCFIGVERERRFVDIALERLQNAKAQKATQ